MRNHGFCERMLISMKKIALLLALLFSFAGLAGCSSDEEIVLRYNVPEKIESLDPANATKESEKTVIRAIFEGLCTLSETGEATAGVAERWEANADNTTFTFYLRKDARWSERTPLTAEDFVFGITRALLPSTRATGLEDLFIIKNAAAVHSGEMDASSLGVQAVDAHTLVITLEKSYADFPKLTAGTRYMPCNQAFFEKTQGRYGLDAERTLTNGAFTFATIYAWESDVSIMLAKTKLYVGDNPAKASELVITMRNSEIEQDSAAALLAGKTDLLKVAAPEAEKLKTEGSEITIVNNGVFGLLFNTQDTYLSEIAYREMLFKTIDRPDLLTRLESKQEEASSFVPKSVQWEGATYRDLAEKLYPAYDEGSTAGLPALLQSKKWGEVPNVKILCRQDDYSYEVATGLIVAWNRAFSSSFNLEVVDDSTFASRIANGEYQAALYTFTAPEATPNSFFRLFRSDAAISLMKNPDFDTAMNTLLFDREKYRELENTIQDEYLFYPLSYECSYYAAGPKTQNIRVSAAGIDFTKAAKKE